jgi:hypothetical protein
MNNHYQTPVFEENFTNCFQFLELEQEIMSQKRQSCKPIKFDFNTFYNPLDTDFEIG